MANRKQIGPQFFGEDAVFPEKPPKPPKPEALNPKP